MQIRENLPFFSHFNSNFFIVFISLPFFVYLFHYIFFSSQKSWERTPLPSLFEDCRATDQYLRLPIALISLLGLFELEFLLNNQVASKPERFSNVNFSF